MKYICQCCGYSTLPQKNGSDYICPVCYWQDDYVQNKDPEFEGGANNENLNQARENYRQYGACNIKYLDKVRPPKEDELN